MRRAVAVLVAAAAVFLAADGVAAMDKIRGARGLYVDVKGQSGKFTIGRRNPPDRDPQKVTVVMDAMRELAADGTLVGKAGKRKHSFNNFASQGFTIGDLVDADLAPGIPGKKIVFYSDLFDNTRVTVETFISLGVGNITIGDEETPVRNGTVKFTIAIDNWAFCDASETDKDAATYCKNAPADGAMVEFDLTIKGKKEKPEKLPNGTATLRRELKGKKKKPQRFKMSESADMDFSTKVRVDGTWQDMADGYPMLTTKGSKNTFTFRFPKGNALFYDPSLTYTSMTDDDGGSGSGSGTGGGDNAASGAAPSLAGAALALLGAAAGLLARE